MSQSTRLSYALIFLLNSMLAWVMLSDYAVKQLREHFDKIPFYKIDCPEGLCYGTLATYRVTMALSMFHLLLAAFTYGVKSTKDVRAALQNGYWGIKLLILTCFMVTAFYLPNSYIIAYGDVSAVAGGVFILIQLVLLIDLAYKWSEVCLEWYEDSDDRKWLALLAVGTLLMFIASIVITGFLFAYYGTGGCQLNQFFISFNLILGVIASVIAIHPRVQEENPQSGLPQAAALTLYTTWLVYSALSSEPNASCNPSERSKDPRTGQLAIGVILTFVSLAYSTSSAAVRDKSFIGASEEGIALVSPSGDDSAQDDIDGFNDESDGTTYSYAFYHLIFCLGSMYVAMLLTNWDHIKSNLSGEDTVHIGRSWDAVWVKIVSSWVAILMYIWTLVAPIVFPDREWNLK